MEKMTLPTLTLGLAMAFTPAVSGQLPLIEDVNKCLGGGVVTHTEEHTRRDNEFHHDTPEDVVRYQGMGESHTVTTTETPQAFTDALANNPDDPGQAYTEYLDGLKNNPCFGTLNN